MAPDATIFFTGDYATNIFDLVVGRDGWTDNVPEEDQVAVKQHAELGLLFWTYHPRTLRKNGIETDVIKYIVQFVVDLYLKRRLR